MNILRWKFADSLATVAKSFPDMSVLKLKQIWDRSDENLVIRQSGKFSDQGNRMMWYAIDKTIKFADTKLTRKIVNNIRHGLKNNLAKNEAEEPDDSTVQNLPRPERSDTCRFILPRPPKRPRRK